MQMASFQVACAVPPASASQRRPPCSRTSRSRCSRYSSGVGAGGSWASAASACSAAAASPAGGSAPPSGFGSSGGGWSRLTYSCVGLNVNCSLLASPGFSVQQTGLAWRALISGGGSSKFMVQATFETFVTTTDSLLTASQGTEARSSLEWDKLRIGATPWPLHPMEKSLAQSEPVIALNVILQSVSVAASGAKVTQSSRRSCGSSMPRAPSPPPSRTATPVPLPSTLSSSRTSVGTS
mmetsp:Transcript_4793/g.14797  ORF Transcript_4793/g.14797 Transcript_4793/m.14797 type:complete len:238 (-) Transcript_4793:1173-1886(-)